MTAISLIYISIPFLTYLCLPNAVHPIIIVYEFLTELGIVALLFGKLLRKRLNQEKIGEEAFLFFSVLMLLLADFIYNVRTYFHQVNFNSFKLVAELSYSAFMFGLFIFTLSKVKPALNDFKSKFASITSFVVVGSLLTKFIILPYHEIKVSFPAIQIFTNTLYTLLSALTVALIIPVTARINRTWDYLFFQAILFALVCDFCIRYQTGYSKVGGMAWAEPGWAASFAIVMVCLDYWRREKMNFSLVGDGLSHWISVRSLLALALCLSNFLFLMALIVGGVFRVANAPELTAVLLALFLLWFLANILSLRLSANLIDIRLLIEKQLKLEKTNSTQTGLHLTKIEKSTFLLEVNTIINAYNDLIKKTDDLVATVVRQQKSVIVEEIASQVAHDIQSPLVALEHVLAHLKDLPEDVRVLSRHATNRIRDIANQLTQKDKRIRYVGISHGKSDQEVKLREEYVEPVLLSGIINTLISEKRLEYRSRLDIDIQFNMSRSAYGLFSVISLVEFKRVLSNIINNAIEAMEEGGSVIIGIREVNQKIEISCQDTGKGIPIHILHHLGNKKITYDKLGGSGLGLYHAAQTSRAWGGEMRVLSNQNQGATVVISLPKSQAPNWFVPELLICDQMTVAILDDDQSIHKVWQDKFGKVCGDRLKVNLKHFSMPDEFIGWVKSNENSVRTGLFLVDYELLSYQQTGLDLIRELRLSGRSVLVTSHFENSAIRSKCDQLGVKLLPKPLASFVPIILTHRLHEA